MTPSTMVVKLVSNRNRDQEYHYRISSPSIHCYRCPFDMVLLLGREIVTLQKPAYEARNRNTFPLENNCSRCRSVD